MKPLLKYLLTYYSVYLYCSSSREMAKRNNIFKNIVSNLRDDFEIEQASDDDDGYDVEEDRAMAEQLEREFMEGEDSLSNSNF